MVAPNSRAGGSPKDPPPKPKYCPACGAQALGEGVFCTTCGGSLASSDPVFQPTGSFGCDHCGGDGQRLPRAEVFCPICRWLRPLGPGYALPASTFLYALDGQAMDLLSSIGPLNAAAENLSGRIGRPWLEASVNGLRLGPDQLGDIFQTAVMAARIVGLRRMPELYISGDQMWEALTLGDADSAFVVIGSVLTNFKDDDLLYVLGREMGHVAAGHALWKTVMQFVSGKHAMNRTVMGDGVMKFLNPGKLLESAIDAPLLAWSRHAEITADRAGALCVGKEAVARRVASQWALKSFPLYARLNQQALERQLAEIDTSTPQAAEWTMSATPFLTRRLKLMQEYFTSEDLVGWRGQIEHWTVEVPRQEAQARLRAEIQAAKQPGQIRLHCIGCGEPMRLPQAQVEGRAEVKIRCPNPACAKVLELTPIPPDEVRVERVQADDDTVRIVCVTCQQPMRAPRSAFAGGEDVNIRCPNTACGEVLTIRPKKKEAAPDPASTPASPPAFPVGPPDTLSEG